jgi:hypothetical protein
MRIIISCLVLAVALGGAGTVSGSPIIELTYTQYLDFAPSVPVGAFVSWTATLDLSSSSPVWTPVWALKSSNLPSGFTNVSVPIVIFRTLDQVTHNPLDAISGVATGGFVWNGFQHYNAYTIQFPNCSQPGGCSASTLGQYYRLPDLAISYATTFDTLSSTTVPEPTSSGAIGVGLILLAGWRCSCRRARI